MGWTPGPAVPADRRASWDRKPEDKDCNLTWQLVLIFQTLTYLTRKLIGSRTKRQTQMSLFRVLLIVIEGDDFDVWLTQAMTHPAKAVHHRLLWVEKMRRRKSK